MCKDFNLVDEESNLIKNALCKIGIINPLIWTLALLLIFTTLLAVPAEIQAATFRAPKPTLDIVDPVLDDPIKHYYPFEILLHIISEAWAELILREDIYGLLFVDPKINDAATKLFDQRIIRTDIPEPLNRALQRYVAFNPNRLNSIAGFYKNNFFIRMNMQKKGFDFLPYLVSTYYDRLEYYQTEYLPSHFDAWEFGINKFVATAKLSLPQKKYDLSKPSSRNEILDYVLKNTFIYIEDLFFNYIPEIKNLNLVIQVGDQDIISMNLRKIEWFCLNIHLPSLTDEDYWEIIGEIDHEWHF